MRRDRAGLAVAFLAGLASGVVALYVAAWAADEIDGWRWRATMRRRRHG